jgi:oligopeptide/dipeptide ABC transporter ATP-binding protein
MTDTPTPVLEIRGLARHFPISAGLFSRSGRVVKAVDGLDFAIPEGQTLALVGESGCGKTTATRLILALDKPTRGQVLLDGQDVHALRGAALRQFRAKVQAVFQDPWSSLNPRMRVRDIVAEPLIANARLTRREVDHQVARVLEAVGLRPEQAQNYPHEFSGGQRQRIAIASALISNPRLIVLDEPVSALDVSIRSQIMNLFKDLQQEFGVSYLLVAHDLATTRYLADQVAVMYLGKIVEIGPSDQIFSDPQHPYTQALFSAALPGHPDDVHEEIILEGEMPSPINPPSGCPFHPRCHLKLGAVCEEQAPALVPSADGLAAAACHRL